MFSKQNEKAEIKHSKTMNWLRSRGKRHKIPCSNDIKQFSISVSASRISTKNSSRLILNSFYTMDEITEVNVLYEKLSRFQRKLFVMLRQQNTGRRQVFIINHSDDYGITGRVAQRASRRMKWIINKTYAFCSAIIYKSKD